MSDNQVITEEAVEAAAKCLPGYDPHWGGDDEDRAENEALRSRARQILEAAAPHMKADAWDEGEEAGGLNHAAEECPHLEQATNPYR